MSAETASVEAKARPAPASFDFQPFDFRPGTTRHDPRRPHPHLPTGDPQRPEAFFRGEDDFRLLYENPEARLIGATELAAHLDEAGHRRRLRVRFSLGRRRPHPALQRLRPGRREAISRTGAALRLREPPAAHRAWPRPSAAWPPGPGAWGRSPPTAPDWARRCAPGVAPLAALCAEAGVPLLLHTNEPVGHDYPGKSPMSLADLYQLLKEHPGHHLDPGPLGCGAVRLPPAAQGSGPGAGPGALRHRRRPVPVQTRRCTGTCWTSPAPTGWCSAATTPCWACPATAGTWTPPASPPRRSPRSPAATWPAFWA